MSERPWMWIAAAASVAALSVGTLTAQALGPRAHARVTKGASEALTAGVEPGEELPSAAGFAGDHGGTVLVDDMGILVVDRGARKLVRTNAAGEPLASLSFGGAPGEIVHDGKGGLFLADRHGDRVVRVHPGDATGAGLGEAASVPVREPHGLALTPDASTLLVTSVAEHQLVALDSADLSERWRLELLPEPRGVAVSATGKTAAVSFLTAGTVAIVDLDRGEVLDWQALDPRDHVHLITEDDGWGGESTVARIEEARSRFAVPVETGRRYARGGFAVAHIGEDMIVAAHQLATPQLRRVPARDRSDTYGGGDASIRPMVHRVSMIANPGELGVEPKHLELAVHQPRALAYDDESDTLLIGGYGDDRVLAVSRATKQWPSVEWVAEIGMTRAGSRTFKMKGEACGVDGLALDGEGGVWAHCEFSRNLVHLSLAKGTFEAGPELAPAARSELVERGAELFRRSNPSTSDAGTLACSNCHPDGRADGLTWRLGKSTLQVPVLAGRVAGTAPFKWDGQDPTLDASLHHTMARLGGVPSEVAQEDFDAIVAYLEDLPPPKPKTGPDLEAVTRGRAVFEAQDCDACHAGDKLADGNQHDLETSMEAVDTPSLLGLSHSAPYYHDGSAKDLRTLVTDRGTIHEMADFSGLSAAEREDLIAYLEVL